MFDSELWLSAPDQQAVLSWRGADVLAEARLAAVERVAGVGEAKRQLDVDELIAVLAFCDAYRSAPGCPVEGGEQLVEVGGDGCPLVAEFAVMELSARLGRTMVDVGGQMAEAQDLAYRFPQLFRQVVDRRVAVWQAAKITNECHELTFEQAAQVDEALSRCEWQSLGRMLRKVRGLIALVAPELAAEKYDQRRDARFVSIAQRQHLQAELFGRLGADDGRNLEATVAKFAEIFSAQGDTGSLDERRARAIGLLAFPARALAMLQSAAQPELWADHDEGPACSAASGGLIGHTCGQIVVDPEKLLPRATLYVHVAAESVAAGEGVARIEGLGPVQLQHLRDLLGETRLRVVPVVDAGAMAPFDAYEIPDRLRTAVIMRNPTEVFPGSGRSSRSCQLDHTVAYQRSPGAPPGQTRPDNLGPLSAKVHRAKTHSGWQLNQAKPGEFTWVSPLGYRYLVTPDRTEYLGNGRLDGIDSPVEP